MNALRAHLLSLSPPARAVVGVAVLLTILVFNRGSRVAAHEIRNNSAMVEGAEVVFVPDRRLSRIMGMGYDQAAADLLWLRTLGYFSKRFVRSREYAWLEHFVHQIIDLDPYFRKVYQWAGASVLYGRRFTNENVLLSNRIYERAMAQFPDDYEPAYRIGLNYYIEMKAKDPAERRHFKEQGLAYLEQAANSPQAPPLIRNFVASVSSKLGKTQLARQYLIDLYLATTDPDVRESLRARITRLDEKSGAQAAESAAIFQSNWRAHFPYVTAPIYALMGEPEQRRIPDRSWRDLVPDVDLQTDAIP